MPQVVKTQPTGAFTPHTKSIGAVIFDKPQYDPLTVQLKVADDLDAWGKQKKIEAQAKKKENDKLSADLNFDDKGAFPDDVDFFTKGKGELINAQVKLDSTDPNSPDWQKNLREAQRTREWYQSYVTSSAGQWNDYVALKKQFSEAPEKYDGDKFNDWDARVRVTRSPQERRKLFEENPLAPPKDNLEELTLDMIKKGKDGGVIAPITIKQDYGKTPDGETIQVEQTQLLPEEKSLPLSADWIANNPKIKDAVMSKFQNMSQADIDYYATQAQQKSTGGRTYQPYDIWYNNVVQKYDVKADKTTQFGYTPEREQKAQYDWGEGKKDEDIGAGLLEQVSGAFQGKSEYLQPIKTYLGYDATEARGLSGYQLGTFTDPYGAEKPNYILEAVRTNDGKIMVLTSKALSEEQKRTNKNASDPKAAIEGDKTQMKTSNLYRSYDNTTQLFNDIATGHFGKDGGEKVKVGAQKYATKHGGYSDATAFDEKKIVPMSQEDIKKRDAIYGKKVTLTPVKEGETPFKKTTKEPAPKKADYTKYPKSSDGKWYWDGTQWLAIK